MKAIVQRSKKSEVLVDKKTVGQIEQGLVVLVGFTHSDTTEDLIYMTNKLCKLRIFDDEAGVMNKSVSDVNGQILLISQFTLYANPYNGNRPSYIDAMKSEQANVLFKQFVEMLNKHIKVETGRFQAEMMVNICNDGPVTIIIDSKNS